MNLLQKHRGKNVFITLLCAFLFLNISTAQLREPFLQHISVEQGLSQSSVYCILQDKKGFLWFGTADGLNKYDGYEITTYRHHQSDTNSLSDNTIRALMEDDKGNLWIGTNEELNVYDQHTRKFTSYSVKGVEALVQDSKRRIWVGSPNGLWMYNSNTMRLQQFSYPQHHKKTNEHRSVKSLFDDCHGNILIGTLDGLDVIDSSGTFRCLDSLFSSITTRNVFIFSMSGTNDGSCWIATWGEGLLRLNNQTWKIEKPIRKNGSQKILDEKFISTLRYDGLSTLWLGTLSNGVISYDLITQEFTPLIHNQRQWELFKAYNNRWITLDRSGLLWIGTDGDGVYKYDARPKKFKHISADEETNNSLSGNFLKAIYEDTHERVWIGTYEHGLTMWEKEKNTFRHFLNKSGSSANGKKETVYAITEDSTGTIWIGTENGLAKFDERNQQFRFHSQSDVQSAQKVTTLFPSSSGNLWAGISSMLFRIHVGTSRIENIPFNIEKFPSLKSASIVCMFEDSHGILWLGTYDGGLNRYDPRTQQCTTYQYDKRNVNTLSQNMVKVIYETRGGTVWIGTGYGLNKFEPETGTFTRFFEEDGLPSAYIYGILEDALGNLWLSTNKGISKFNPTTKQFKNYGIEDGLQSNEFNSGACFKNMNGEMYFGGINGLNIFHPDSVKDNPVLPQMVLTGLKILDLPVEMKGEVSELDTIQLDYEEGIFSIRFAALEFSNSKKNQYAYLLEGFEEHWVYSGTRREVRYTHLDPGEYVFRVKGSNNDGIWNEEGIAVNVVVVPPFWRTWWFLSFAGLAVLFSIGGTIRSFEMRRVRRQMELLEREREMEHERARISQDMHDEIGASLTQIAILSEIAQRDLNNTLAVENQLQKISNNARDVIDSIGEIIWAINPKNDSLDNLISFIREYASGFFEGTETRCHFSIPDMIPVVTLSGEHRRNIFLVVKESLNNILKHANAKEVYLQFTTTVDSFTFIIQDNGKGFFRKEISGLSNGLNNMKRRMENIGGTFTIESTPNLRTTVKVRFQMSEPRA